MSLSPAGHQAHLHREPQLTSARAMSDAAETWSPLTYALLSAAAVLVTFAAGRTSAWLQLALVVAATAAVSAPHVTNPGARTESEWQALVKVAAVLPLGLGSLALFGAVSPTVRARWLPAFTTYVNAAVLGNIAIMLCVPSGGTWRGLTSRLTCLTLLAWLALEMVAVRWRTIALSEGVVPWPFLFTASPSRWVLAHAAYRALLMTLPMFDTERYWAMEPLSLGVMALHHATLPPAAGGARDHKGRGKDTRLGGTVRGHSGVATSFGASDTTTVAAMAVVGRVLVGDAVTPLPVWLGLDGWIDAAPGGTADLAAVTCHSVIMCVALREVLRLSTVTL